MNECVTGTHTCKDNEICVNNNGGFDCAADDCDQGYRFSNLTGQCTGIKKKFGIDYSLIYQF